MSAVYVAFVLIVTSSGQVAIDSSQRFVNQTACELYLAGLKDDLNARGIYNNSFCEFAQDEVPQNSGAVAAHPHTAN